MITLTRLYGQTSNNFIQHIHLDAFCRENGIVFKNPRLSKYYKIYPNLRTAGYGSAVTWTRVMAALSLKERPHFTEPENQEYYEQQLKKGGKVFCKGWFFRSPDEAIKKYIPVYQHLFKPAIDTQSLDARFFGNSNDPVIAVHIRRGDYKEFLDGRYFFSDEVYIDKISQVVALLGQPCRIILFTNDPELNFSLYKEKFSNVMLAGNSVVADHYVMSRCNYIIGPFSTFSLWASFIGQQPFHHIFSADEVMTLERFRVCKGNWW